jgi:hypothetical protein
MPLQRRTALTLFRRVGASHVPWPLVHLLQQFDAPHAVVRFCGLFHIDDSALLDARSRDHAQAKKRLKFVVDILLHAEMVSYGTGLSLEPVIAAFEIDDAKPTEVLYRLERASGLARLLGSLNRVTWISATQFSSAATGLLADWSSADDAELDQIAQSVATYIDLFDQSTQAADSIRGLLDPLFLDGYDEDVQHAARRILESSDSILELLLTSDEDPSSYVEELLDLLLDAETLSNAREGTQSGVESEQEILKAKFAVLGLDIGVDEKTAERKYRKLARDYHPDLHPGNPEILQMAQMINEAWDAIKRWYRANRI